MPPSPSFFAPPLPHAGTCLHWEGLAGSAAALALSAAAAQRPVLVITPDTAEANRLVRACRFFIDADVPVLFFPDWECLPYDLISPHPGIVSQRLGTLQRLPQLRRGLVVACAATLMQRLPTKAFLARHSFDLATGQKLDPALLRGQLETGGYQHVGQVMAPGEYAVRGGLIDLFPTAMDAPVRIDWLDDAIESIRHFDPESQRSGGSLEKLQLLPAREIPLNEAGIGLFRAGFRRRFTGDPNRFSVYRDVSEGYAPAGVEFYLPLFFEQPSTIFDFLPEDLLFVLSGDLEADAGTFAGEVQERFEMARIDPDRPATAPQELYLDPESFCSTVQARAHIRMSATRSAHSTVKFPAHAPRALPITPRTREPLNALQNWLADFPGRVLLMAETAGHRESLLGVLREHGLHPEPCERWQDFVASQSALALCTGALEQGLEIDTPPLAIVTESQLYGPTVYQQRRRRRTGADPEGIIRSLAELAMGDPVVHEDHGIGRFAGLKTLTAAGVEAEFLVVEYRDGDKLYVPVLALDRISRYTASGAEHAPLHKLGGPEWERIKRRAREKVHDVAVELLDVQAARAARQGHAFPGRDDSFAAFAASFPFEETPDQDRVIDEVLADMESAQPMDRLVCGDVGFGKTEVAMRAAYLAVAGNRQVAVLVPTTLLARQHDETFRDRFADVPCRIEQLSRFQTAREAAVVLEGLQQGTVDIVIGTHRLLQKDVHFRRLGLVILDEEHRFGVRQKEALKRLRREVDVLTLTATPIPRTLNLAMAGMRDISLIVTPPNERLSVSTFVQEWSDAHIREACMRELRRGGQIFFLHNQVKTISRMAEQLGSLVPELRIAIAHGQLPERQLEQVMRDFYHQRSNLLVCSTIIESGIDIPTANTIIINRADRFGLAQLHQLRGRVGRSHHRAYAYLIIPTRRALKPDAIKRLDAIAQLDQLGVGFSLASHDLEIRGAGELLGESQSGLIDEVGFGLYTDLLNRAIASLRSGEIAPQDDARGAEIDLHVSARLPEDYIPDTHTRLVLYKRLVDTPADVLDALRVEFIDRFGPLPEAAQHLFGIAALRQRAQLLGITRIDLGPDGGRLDFTDQPRINAQALVQLVQQDPEQFRLRGPQRLALRHKLPKFEDRLRVLQELLQMLGG